MTKSDSLDLFIFVDALGWKQVQSRGFLEDILPIRQRCRTVFGYSSTCDPTILTGCMPDEHGHFSCFIRAEVGKSPFKALGAFSFLPQKIAGWHRIRNRVSRFVGNQLNYTGYFQLYSVPFGVLPYLDYTEKKDIYQPGGILGGQEAIFAHWARSGKPWVRSDWHKGDDENIAQTRAEIEKGEIALAYLFTAKPDALMHKYGTTGPEVEAGFQKLALDIRSLFELAQKRYRTVNFHVFSDHGMSDTTTVSTLLPKWNREIKAKYGRDYVSVWDSTMARFWFNNDTVRAEATDWLRAQTDGRILTEQELRRWRCWWDDSRYGELIYLLPPGSIFAPSFMNQGFVAGMHGYEVEHEECDASWLTNAEGRLADGLEDIFPIMLAASKKQNLPNEVLV